MSLVTAYCPKCGGQLEAVDTQRLQRESKPDGYRCALCGVGWEMMALKKDNRACWLVSEAPLFDKPSFKVVG